MIAMVIQNPELIIGGIAFAVQWGYSMHRLKTLEESIDELRSEFRENKKNEPASS